MTREFPGGVLRPVVVGGLLVATAALACATPASADWLGGERPVTTGAGSQQWPQLSGSRLVYTDESADGGFDVRVHDLDTGTDRAVTTDHSATGRAAISGNRVVWVDSDAGVWYADLATGKHRRLSDGVGDGPSISGRLVCYTSLGDVHVHDLRTGSDQVVSAPAARASNCDISGELVVWQDDRFGNADVFGYDLTTRTETRITSDPSGQTMPRVDGDLVVWQDDAKGADDTDIVAVDLSTGVTTLVCGAVGAQSLPEVAQGRIVWTDARFGDAAVFLYDMLSGVETRVTDDAGLSGGAALSGGRIVYAQRSSGHHLFVRTITPPVLSTELAPVVPGDLPRLSGVLARTDGLPVIAVVVQLESSADGRAWVEAGSAVTAGDGSYAFTLPESPLPVWFRVRFDGAQDVAPVVGEPVRFEGAR
ncbi:MAG: hypothetical protein KDB60_12500 [Propionibacteriaceae bacterium]|nr:hypothetical protein [Propionibacteriaceae bacterium]